MHFALIYKAPLMVMQKLDWVLDCDHVLFALVVNLVEHRGERRGLARTGRPGDQHQPSRLFAQALHDRWQSKAVKALDLPRNGPEHGAHCAPLLEQIAAESRQVLETKGKIELQIFLETVLLRVGQHA